MLILRRHIWFGDYNSCNLSDHLITQGNQLSSNFDLYLIKSLVILHFHVCTGLSYLTNVVNKCGKKVQAKMSEAIEKDNVHVRVLNVHI